MSWKKKNASGSLDSVGALEQFRFFFEKNVGRRDMLICTSAGDTTKGRLDEGSVVHPRAWAPKIGMNGGYLGVQAARIVRSVLVVPRFFFSETAMGAHWPESVKSLLCLCHGTCGLGYRWRFVNESHHVTLPRLNCVRICTFACSVPCSLSSFGVLARPSKFGTLQPMHVFC